MLARGPDTRSTGTCEETRAQATGPIKEHDSSGVSMLSTGRPSRPWSVHTQAHVTSNSPPHRGHLTPLRGTAHTPGPRSQREHTALQASFQNGRAESPQSWGASHGGRRAAAWQGWRTRSHRAVAPARERKETSTAPKTMSPTRHTSKDTFPFMCECPHHVAQKREAGSNPSHHRKPLRTA